jgi:hypothetical protein
MGHLTAAKLQMNLHLVSLVQELLGMADLGEIVMLVDVHAEFHFLDLPRSVLLLLLLLGQIVSKLAEIDDPTDWRLGAWGYFYQVEADRAGMPESFLDAHNPQLLVRNAIDHAHFTRSDAFVDADVS